jgi:hypothetical protein
MANCHQLFQHFNSAIKLSDEDRQKLKASRNTLRDRIRIGYEKLPGEAKRTHQLKFQTQGSFIMDTIIKPWDDDFDLDDGVYFIGQIPQAYRQGQEQAFHDLIIKSIEKYDGREEVIDKPTCVRVKYLKLNGDDLGFHIDLPIYYKQGYNTPELADTKKKWTISDPVAFIEWFESKTKSDFNKSFLLEYETNRANYKAWLSDIRKKDVQLRRLVRYMKAWADLERSEMPCGIIMTVLVAENFVENERDDIAFRDTLIAIRTYLARNDFKCPRPTTPVGEDLFASTSSDDKEYFRRALNALIVSANSAIEAVNEKDACEKWRGHFGRRFPCHLAKDTPMRISQKEPTLDSLKSTIVHKPWLPRS